MISATPMSETSKDVTFLSGSFFCLLKAKTDMFRSQTDIFKPNMNFLRAEYDENNQGGPAGVLPHDFV